MGDRENDDMFDLLSMQIDFHFSEGQRSKRYFSNFEHVPIGIFKTVSHLDIFLEESKNVVKKAK